jgi:transcriptional regulator with XRE-family HTH domain
MTQTVNQLLAKQIRKVRDAENLRQDELAKTMRRVWGLNWSRATIAALETGKRQLTIEEFLVLLGTYPDRFFSDVDQDEITVGAARLPTASIIGLFSLKQLVPYKSRPSLLERIAESNDMGDLENWVHLENPNVPPLILYEEVNADAEQKTAKALSRMCGIRITPMAVVVLARNLWEGRSLSAKRDEEAKKTVGDSADERTLQAVRGHVTRQLVKQLKAAIKMINPSTKQQTRRRKKT